MSLERLPSFLRGIKTIRLVLNFRVCVLTDCFVSLSPWLGCSDPDEDEAEGTEGSKSKLKSRSDGTGLSSKGSSEAKRRRVGTEKDNVSKPKRPRSSRPYVEVEYEEETEDGLPQGMSVNW